MERSQNIAAAHWRRLVFQRKEDVLNAMHRVYMHRVNELLAQEAKLGMAIQFLFDYHLKVGEARISREMHQDQLSGIDRAAQILREMASMTMHQPQPTADHIDSADESTECSDDTTASSRSQSDFRSSSIPYLGRVPPLISTTTPSAVSTVVSASHRSTPPNCPPLSMPELEFLATLSLEHFCLCFIH